MNLPNVIPLEGLPDFDADFSFNASTPVPKVLSRKSSTSRIKNECSFLSEFMEDDLFDDFFDDDSEERKKSEVNSIINDNQDKGSPFNICESQVSTFKKCSLLNSLKSKNSQELSPVSNNDISSHIIKKLKKNAANSPQVSFHELKKTSIFFALDDAQKIQEQLSQTSVGPFYGLPSKTTFLLKCHKGIDNLYEWQKECLTLPAIQNRQNLIYSLPTSGGKTLVAEILIMKELLCHLKNVIFVLPYVSLVQEKVRGLAPFAVDLDFVIEEYAGIKGLIPPRRRRKRQTLFVCTIEKAHSIVNSLIENHRLDEIGLVVVDELHMIGESGGRGAILETLLSKLMFLSKAQLIGMSATLSNMNDLQQFLHADIYEKNFRPVELKEYVKVGLDLFELSDKASNTWTLARKLDFNYTKEMKLRDPEMVTGLVLEVIPQNSCLIFCPTKKHCENVAITICELIPQDLLNHNAEEKKSLLNALSQEGNGNMCTILKHCIKYGVAYHHSGLTMEERKLIEEAYVNNTLCCLTCTSTLAAGVNLPAKRVILRAPYVGIDFITYSRYKQMVGRAGRAGIDSSGESILIIKDSDKINIEKLFNSNKDMCLSNFIAEPDKLNMLLLSLVGLELAHNMKDIYNFMNYTLLAVQSRNTGSTPSSVFEDAIQTLYENGLIQFNSGDATVFSITVLGRAAFRGSVDIDTMHEFKRRLRSGLNGLVLHSHLHLLHLVTPSVVNVDEKFFIAIPLLPDLLFKKYNDLSPEDLITAEQIGITEQMIMLMVSGRSFEKSKRVLHQFYLTLILYDIWKQNSIWQVARTYNVHRGVIQSLLNSASAMAGTLSNFCQEIGEFWAFQQLLPSFVKQLSYCVTSELLPLMELPTVKRGRAKQLYLAGYKNLTDIAKVHPKELVSNINHMPRKVAEQIVSAAKMILLEKAEVLKEEADLLIEDFDKNCSILNDID